MTPLANKTCFLFGLLAMLIGLNGCQEPKVVVTAEQGKLTVADEKGENAKTHEVAPDAKITRDGRPAELEDLRPGDKVQVRAKEEEVGKSIVREVKAESEDKTNPPATDQPDAGQDPIQSLPLGTKTVPATEQGALPIGESSGAAATDQPKLEGEATPPPQDHARTGNEPATRAKQSADADGVRATFEGNIVSVEKNKLRVLVGDQEKALLVAEDVQIVFDGNEASLEDLKPGHFVTVEAEMTGNQFQANSINVRIER